MLLDEKHVKKCLELKGIDAEIVCFDEPVMRSDQAKNLVSGHIVKSVLIMVEDRPVLCILPGAKKVDFEKIKRIFNASEVRLAKAREVKQGTGYDIGALPPTCHKQEIETLVDESVFTFDEFYCGGGSHYCLLKITREEFSKLNFRKEKFVE